MKRILTAFVLLAYFMVSTGFAVSTHYCMDEFDSAQLGTSNDDICNRCGMDTGDNKCCRDEVTVHKLQTSHTFSQGINFNPLMAELITELNELLITPFRNFKPSLYTISHSPPLNDGQEIYIENCVFRI